MTSLIQRSWNEPCDVDTAAVTPLNIGKCVCSSLLRCLRDALWHAGFHAELQPKHRETSEIAPYSCWTLSAGHCLQDTVCGQVIRLLHFPGQEATTKTKNTLVFLPLWSTSKASGLSWMQGPRSLHRNVSNEDKSCQQETAMKCELNVSCLNQLDD